MLPQDPTAFTNGNTSNLQANYALGMDGLDPGGLHYGLAGTFALNTAMGVSTASEYDDNDGGTGNTGAAFTSLSIASVNSQTGRGLMSIDVPSTNSSYAIYIANANEFFIVGIDPYDTNTMVTGRAIATAANTTFSN